MRRHATIEIYARTEREGRVAEIGCKGIAIARQIGPRGSHHSTAHIASALPLGLVFVHHEHAPDFAFGRYAPMRRCPRPCWLHGLRSCHQRHGAQDPCH